MPSTNPTQKRYLPELKERAVRMAIDLRSQDPADHTVIARVARQLGVGAEYLRIWVKQHDVDGGRRAGTTTAEHDELIELRKEVRELRRANEILQAAASFMRTPRLCGLGPVAGGVGAGQGGSDPGRRSA